MFIVAWREFADYIIVRFKVCNKRFSASYKAQWIISTLCWELFIHKYIYSNHFIRTNRQCFGLKKKMAFLTRGIRYLNVGIILKLEFVLWLKLLASPYNYLQFNFVVFLDLNNLCLFSRFSVYFGRIRATENIHFPIRGSKWRRLLWLVGKCSENDAQTIQSWRAHNFTRSTHRPDWNCCLSIPWSTSIELECTSR